MRNIKLTIEYDGTNYGGWQKQNNIITIQGIIESALCKIMNEPIELIGASRTDSGVHALGQIANFKTNSNIPIENVCRALNSMIPNDIVIKSSDEVHQGFHSRFSAKRKKYIYKILNNTIPTAINRDFVYHYPIKLDYDKMKIACQYFVGEHDFTSFRSVGSSVKINTRTIFSCELLKEDNLLQLNIDGNGFLYNMVRIIVGTLIEVGLNKIQPESVKEIIESKERKRAGKTAPAHGLYLVEVFY